jgi:hypothetical protein
MLDRVEPPEIAAGEAAQQPRSWGKKEVTVVFCVNNWSDIMRKIHIKFNQGNRKIRFKWQWSRLGWDISFLTRKPLVGSNGEKNDITDGHSKRKHEQVAFVSCRSARIHASIFLAGRVGRDPLEREYKPVYWMK